MSILSRLDEHGARALAARVTVECGGPFDTTVVGSREVCVVCAAPRSRGFDTCARCGRDRHAHGDRLADVVVPLTYAVSDRAAGTLVHLYKSPLARERQRLNLRVVFGRLLRVGLGLHRPCIEARLGREITTWVSVPSTTPGTVDPHRSPVSPTPADCTRRGPGCASTTRAFPRTSSTRTCSASRGTSPGARCSSSTTPG